MKLIVLGILFIFSGNYLLAQNSTAAVFVSNNHKNNEGIQIKWLYSTVYHPDGFIIQRKEENGQWQQINPTPIKVMVTLPSSNNLSKDEKDLHKAVSTVSYDEFKHSIVRAFVMINSITNNEFAEYIGVYYLDKTAQQGKIYEYKISLKTGEELAVSSKIKCENYTKIEGPKGLKVFRTRKSVSINWTPEVYRYYGVHIYRKNNNGGEFEKLTKSGPIALNAKEAKNANENSKFYIDTNIVYEESYSYKLMAVDYFGLESEFSIEVAAPAQDFIPPAAPFNLKVYPSSSKSQVVLNWEYIDEADLAGFKVYYSKNPNDTFQVANAGQLNKSSTTFVHENLLPGPYFYMVSSVDFANNESFSNPFTTEIRDVIPPLSPSGVKTEALSGEIKISWTANKEGDLAGYYIEKSLYDSTNTKNNYFVVNAAPITETFYVEKLPMNIKNKFVYRVIAVDTNYNRSNPSINSLAQMPDVIPPNQPVIRNISIVDGAIRIDWLPNVENDLLGYDIYRYVNNDTSTLSKINFNVVPGSLNQYNDRNFEKGQLYNYRVVAKDQNQNQSKASESFPFRVASDKTDATIVVKKADFNAKRNQVTLQWDLQGNVEMKGYVVYQKDTFGNFKPLTGLSNFTEFVSKEINSSTLEFEIRGYTSDGTIIKTEKIILNI
jgi:uncharacterized protein